MALNTITTQRGETLRRRLIITNPGGGAKNLTGATIDVNGASYVR